VVDEVALVQVRRHGDVLAAADGDVARCAGLLVVLVCAQVGRRITGAAGVEVCPDADRGGRVDWGEEGENGDSGLCDC
jgi:hypothetical protein